jgi:hypothetical protein
MADATAPGEVLRRGLVCGDPSLQNKRGGDPSDVLYAVSTRERCFLYVP